MQKKFNKRRSLSMPTMQLKVQEPSISSTHISDRGNNSQALLSRAAFVQALAQKALAEKKYEKEISEAQQQRGATEKQLCTSESRIKAVAKRLSQLHEIKERMDCLETAEQKCEQCLPLLKKINVNVIENLVCALQIGDSKLTVKNIILPESEADINELIRLITDTVRNIKLMCHLESEGNCNVSKYASMISEIESLFAKVSDGLKRNSILEREFFEVISEHNAKEIMVESRKRRAVNNNW